MLFLPFSFLFFLFFLFLLPVIFIFVQIGLVSTAFVKLGLTPTTGILLFFLSLIGSTINIPIAEKRIDSIPPPPSFSTFFGCLPFWEDKIIIAINVGGALIPLLLTLYLLPKVWLPNFLIAVGIITVVCYVLATPVRGAGIMLPAFIPPIIASILALILAPNNPAPLAYSAGVVGTLMGADILHLPQIEKIGAGFISIGGAGIYDGIYLVGIISALLL